MKRFVTAGLVAWLAFLPIGGTLHAGEMSITTADAFWRFNAAESPSARRAWLDAQADAVASHMGETLGLTPVELIEVLERSDSDEFTLTATDSLEIFVNPEPSSMLVWAATSACLTAAGYGYKRRNRDEEPAASAAA